MHGLADGTAECGLCIDLPVAVESQSSAVAELGATLIAAMPSPGWAVKASSIARPCTSSTPQKDCTTMRKPASKRTAVLKGPEPTWFGTDLGPAHKAPRTLDTGTHNAQTSDGGRVKRTGTGLGIERRACLDIGTRNAQLASPTLQPSTQIATTNECHSCP